MQSKGAYSSRVWGTEGMFARAAAIIGSSTVLAAYVYRPLPSGKKKEGAVREWRNLASTKSLSEETYSSPFLIWLGRAWLTPLIVTMSRIFLRVANNFEIVKDDNYWDFIDAVTARGPEQALVTVSNHRSLMDDPPLISNILPYHVGIQPRYLRFGACAEEFCYNDSFPGLVYAFMGAGRSLPMWRGMFNFAYSYLHLQLPTSQHCSHNLFVLNPHFTSLLLTIGGGIDQKMLLDFARHVAFGEWIHIFPEAGIWQHADGHLGGRDSPGWKGRLKWGVGKLIAHSPCTPIVIPFFHMGMEEILPQNPNTRKTISFIPKLFNNVTVKFGEAIEVEDLILEYERNHGPLPRYSASAAMDSLNNLLRSHRSHTMNVSAYQRGGVECVKWWKSDMQQQILYHKITLRVENALTKLAKQHHSK